MEYPRIKKRQKKRPVYGVYADLDELIRLQYKAQGFSFLPRQPIHSILSGRHASRLRGRGLNFEEIRGYLPGDDIRNMDWKVTARMQKPHVRVYTEERDRPVLLLIDQRITMFFGSQQCMKSVTAAEIAALSAWRVISVGDRVGAIVFDDKDMKIIPPQRSRQQVIRILQAVVEKNHRLALGKKIRPNPNMINKVMERVLRLAKHDFLICSIGDGSGVNEDTVRLATAVTAHNDMLACFIYDPLESDLPDMGRIVVSEEELQLEINTSDKTLRKQFSDDFTNRRSWIQKMSRLRSIPILPFHTGREVAEQARDALGYHPPVRRV
jgi:uncharacterized protein (DUF58 family)